MIVLCVLGCTEGVYGNDEDGDDCGAMWVAVCVRGGYSLGLALTRCFSLSLVFCVALWCPCGESLWALYNVFETLC